MNNIHMLMQIKLIRKIEKPLRISHISKNGMDAFLCKSIPIAFLVRGDMDRMIKPKNNNVVWFANIVVVQC